MAQTCQYLSQGYIANPDNCQSYGYCSGGQLLGNQTCNEGYLFNSYQGACMNATTVICSTNTDDICLNVPNNQIIADPDNCANFCQCINGKPSCNTCGSNLVFNPTLVQCVYPSQYSCPSGSICQLVPNNMFVGDPENCGNYIRCNNGAGASTKCPTATDKFDPIRGGCSPTYTCSSGGGGTTGPTTGPGVLSPLPNSAAACSAYSTTGAATQYFGDGQTCMGYYACTSASGPGAWSKCQTNLHFNPTRQECVSPLSYNCPYDRCGNMQGQFMAKAGCLEYYSCTNQTTVATAACTDPVYKYFDESKPGCTNVLPTYTICA